MEAHQFIVEFCQQFEHLYGKENLVINLHLACHLKECILDYGPVSGFWCFGFERFNGILGSFPNNHHNVSITMMKKFEDYLQVNCGEFGSLLSQLSHSNDVTGSLSDTKYGINCNFKLLKPLREYILPSDCKEHLIDMYSHMYSFSICVVSALCIHSAKLFYAGHILSSSLTRSESGSCIAAYLFPNQHPSSSRHHVGIVK